MTISHMSRSLEALTQSSLLEVRSSFDQLQNATTTATATVTTLMTATTNATAINCFYDCYHD